MQGYDFTKDDLALLLLRRWYPERTDHESVVLREFLFRHGAEYDRFSFSVRIGESVAPNPDHPESAQRSTVFSSRKKIDMLAWSGEQATIVEVKARISPASLGQILTYQQLFLEEKPDAMVPLLVVIGQQGDDDTLRALSSHGVTVHVYENATVDRARAVTSGA